MEQAADTAAAGRLTRFAVRILAGLQLGIFAGLLILTWIVFGAMLAGVPVWLIPNNLASFFYGPQSVRSDFGLYTCAGMALLLVECAAAAMPLALWAPRVRWRTALAGSLVYSFGLMWAANRLIWPSVSPHLPGMVPSFIVWMGFLILAFCLSFIPFEVRELERKFLLE